MRGKAGGPRHRARPLRRSGTDYESVSVVVAFAWAPLVVSLLLSLLLPDLLDEATTRRVKRFRPRRERRDFDIGSPPSRGKS
jgi:hypothetical protein